MSDLPPNVQRLLRALREEASIPPPSLSPIWVDAREIADDEILSEIARNQLPTPEFVLCCQDDYASLCCVRLRAWTNEPRPGIGLDDDGCWTLRADRACASLLWSPDAVRTARDAGTRPTFNYDDCDDCDDDQEVDL